MAESQLLELRKFVAPEFVFGPGAAALAGRYVANFGARTALLVTDAGVLQAGLAEPVCASLDEAGIATVLFAEVSSNPRESEVMAGAERYAREHCEALVAVGGGSPLDAAKAIGVVHANQMRIQEMEGVDNVPRPGPPLVCVPTTAGSSADVSQFAIVTDTERRLKFAVVSKTMVPDVSLIDAGLTVSMGPELTAHTGLDALTHAVEAYVSNASSPVSDLFALEAVRRIAGALPKAVDHGDDLVARSEMMLGSLYAGLAFSNAILGAVHAMAHSLGGLLDLPHGLCNAILLEPVVAYNFPSAPARFRELARVLSHAGGAELDPGGGDEDHLDALLAALRRLRESVGVRCGLAELGVCRDDLTCLTALAARALNDPCMATNPRQATLEEVVELYVQAL